MNKQASVIDTVKQLLADPKDRIKLDDYVTGLLRHMLEMISTGAFCDDPGSPTADAIQRRLQAYEDASRELCDAVVLLVRWGREDALLLLRKIATRLADPGRSRSNFTFWHSMPWYPLSLISYCAGIAALYAENYSALHVIFLTQVSKPNRGTETTSLAVRVSDEVNQLGDGFKLLAAHKQHRVPRSEYVFALLQKPLDDLLFLGPGYEAVFDQFEILNALVYADQTASDQGRVWAAPGRFGWKFYRDGGPYNAFVKEATDAGDHWAPLQVGFFQGSQKRFQEVEKAYRAFLSRLNWY